MHEELREIEAAIGVAGTLEFVRRWGGRAVRIPVKVDEGSPLTLSLGSALTERLVTHFPDRTFQVPIERAVLRAKRDALIVAAHDAGQSARQIAIDFGLTRQGVMAVLKRSAAAPVGQARPEQPIRRSVQWHDSLNP